MKLQLIALIFGVLSTAPSSAQQLTLKADAPAQYQVKTGDTLWGIAGLYLAKPWLWPELWEVNPGVKNPDLIYPGDLLTLRFDAQGRPILQREESEPPLSFASESVSATSDRVIKLKPRVRALQRGSALDLLPGSLIQSFLVGHRLVAPAELEQSAYVVGATVAVKNAVSGHLIYVQGNLDTGQAYGVYRQADAVADPLTGDELGIELVPLARLKLLPPVSGQQEGLHRAELFDSRQEVRQGDWVMALRQSAAVPARFNRVALPASTKGLILSSASGFREFANWEVLLVNLGAEQGLMPGQLLSVLRPSPRVLDGTPPSYPQDSDAWQRLTGAWFSDREMPTEVVGKVMVLEPQAKASYVIVLDALMPLHLGDWVGGQDAGQHYLQTNGSTGADRP